MTDRHRAAASDDNPSGEDNPFAPPPEDRPDQPWRPRGQRDASGNGAQEGGTSTGSAPSGTDSEGSGSESGQPGSEQGGSPWSNQWSSRQPGRQSGEFGAPGGTGGPEGGGPQRGLRWDPTDRYQRHARYALHAGIWALFFALFSLWQVGLLLGALSVYWGVSALRSRTSGASGDATSHASAEDVAGTSRGAADGSGGRELPGPLAVSPAQAARAKKTAAVSGLVTAGLGLCVIAATFTVQAVYKDYFDCRQDALTQSSRDSCDQLVPKTIRPLLEDR